MENSRRQRITRFSAVLIAVSIVVGAVAGGFLSYSLVSKQIADLQNQVSMFQEQVATLRSAQNITNVFGGNVSLSALYEKIKGSVVTIYGFILQTNSSTTYYTRIQGSGFVYNYTGQMIIVTNFHVVHTVVNITVTFIDGNSYRAVVLGSDPYADLAVLSTNAPQNEYKPIEIVSSSILKVGDPIIAVGNPYGLTGSMTTGIVSQLGRSITEETTGGYSIANIIQITAPINPGNSGGPLLNYMGQVVGITAAIISNSQGLGFAIPSSTILREIGSLVKEGSYNHHPWLGVTGTDMSYEIATKMGINVTYGWLIVGVISGGPAEKAGLRGGTEEALIAGSWVTIGGDVIIAIDGKRITNMDDLTSYLEEHTSPGQVVNIAIVRNGQTMTVQVELGTRPPPSIP